MFCDLLWQLARFIHHRRHIIIYVLARCKPCHSLQLITMCLIIVWAGHVIAVHDLHATVVEHPRSSTISSSSSSSNCCTVVDARNISSAFENAANDHVCDVHLDHLYLKQPSPQSPSHITTVFLHAATSGHRWQNVLRSMLLVLLQNSHVQSVVVVAVGPQAAAACSLSFFTLDDASASQGREGRPTLFCKPSEAPLYQREIPTLEMLHGQCLLPHLRRTTVMCVRLQHHSFLP